MTVDEFLKRDSSYLYIPKVSKYWDIIKFWKDAKKKGIPDKAVGTKGNQRESFEEGVKIGWSLGRKDLEHSGTVPNPVNLTTEEYSDFIHILNAFGYQFMYVTEPSVVFSESLRKLGRNPSDINGFNPGINICRNSDMPGILSDVQKQKILEIIYGKRT